MAVTKEPRILLTGATGYIGGTILTRLLSSSSPILTSASITCLVRGAERASRLTAAYGPRVQPVVYESLDDIETTTATAAQHDVVINTALGYHSASGLALVRGLAQRKAETGRDVWIIHTSGTSNLADLPVTGKRIEKGEFNDETDDVYGYETRLELQEPYPQRTAELGVMNESRRSGVRALVIMSPTIYGHGLGLFNTASIQIPAYINIILDQGRGVVLGEGRGVWDHVHVEDLAELYEIVTKNILEQDGKDLPPGSKGIIFSGNGRHSWLEVAQMITDACYGEGKVKEQRVHSVGISEGVSILGPRLGGADETVVELALASNSRTVASVARRLGWNPTRGEDTWKSSVKDDVKAVLDKRAN
ncbi:NAD dependent epimerase/dehydratase family protein-like protein [Colletotrichum zoysiae]|uniref:NAD dependent epimerase/dehydratase family protein-like protein n=1 Tax=Colletotrichum zoysiae TaxID=1216348 RepID=A0AAD9H9J2_9PEZI|nr:NAD dependent epimerase/dehydratase family protein-like protein [Colletotrichum zoysiae]